MTTYSYKVILRNCVDVGITKVIKLFWEGVGDEDIGRTKVRKLLKLGRM